MSKVTNSYFVVFDSEMNCNVFDINTLKSEFETQEEAFEVAKAWKLATSHTLTLKCIYTTEADFITF